MRAVIGNPVNFNVGVARPTDDISESLRMRHAGYECAHRVPNLEVEMLRSKRTGGEFECRRKQSVPLSPRRRCSWTSPRQPNSLASRSDIFAELLRKITFRSFRSDGNFSFSDVIFRVGN